MNSRLKMKWGRPDSQNYRFDLDRFSHSVSSLSFHAALLKRKPRIIVVVTNNATLLLTIAICK